MDIKFFAATDVGRQREHNEDNYLVDPKLRLFIVADGMGGHAAGEVASQIAVHEVCRAVREREATILKLQSVHLGDSGDGAEARKEILGIMEQAVQHACATIFRSGQEDPTRRGMGTTTSALLLVGDRGFIAHVGDSRIYLLRQGQVHQITEDHSLVNELVKRGKIKRDEIDSSPYARYKNAVTRAVGANESVDVDTLDFDVMPGDRFLLCSDGLYFYLNDPELAEVLSSSDVSEAPKKLVALANSGGGHDNITAVVVRMVDEASKNESLRASDLANRIDVLKAIPLFRHLHYKEIMHLLNVTVVREYAAGGPVIKEGTPGEEMFVILGGKVRVHKAEAFICHLERGAHLGEMALVDRGPRSASATAEEATRMLVLRRPDFYEIIRKEPALATKILWSFVQVMADRLRKTTADLSEVRLDAEDDLTDILFDKA